jgi:hypothetical protein
MTQLTTANGRAGDRTLRIVMWLDAFLSVAFVAAGIVAAPLVAALGLPAAARLAVGIVTLVAGALLAMFGAITAVVLMARMRRGDVTLPQQLWLPLPPAMRPAEYRRAS